MTDDPLCARLLGNAEGLECAADAEQLVIDGLKPFRARFNDGERTNYISRRVRVLLDAEKNQRNFLAEAADLRSAIAIIKEYYLVRRGE